MKQTFQNFLFLTIIFYLAPSTGFGQSSSGCLLKFGERILTVKDHWSNRLSLPGGGIRDGESASKAAARETLEETGLKAEAKTLIAKFGSFALFACQVSEVRAQETKTGLIKLVVPPAARSEIGSINLTPADALNETTWRFPSQLQGLKAAIDSVQTNNKYELIASSPDQPYWIAVQHEAAKAMQRATLLHPLMWLVNFFGEEHFFFLVLPWLLVGVHRKFGLQVAAMIVFSSLLNGALKEILQAPRPSGLWGDLELMPATGWGFPSGHTQVAATFYTLIGLKFRDRYPWLLPAGLLAAALTGIARVYFGAHFFHDVVVGWLVGLVFAAVFYRRWNFWIFLLLSLFLVPMRFHPDAVASMAAYIGIMFGLRWLPGEHLPRRAYFGSCIMVLCGLFMLPLGIAGVFPADRTFMVMLIRQVVMYFALGLWASLGTHYIPKLLSFPRFAPVKVNE